MLVEGLHLFSTTSGDQVRDLVGSARILDALLDGSRRTHYFDGGYTSILFFIAEKSKGDDGLKILSKAGSDVDLFLGWEE